MQKRFRCIPQEVLKLIACVTMLIDHFGATIVIRLSVPYLAELYYACRIIGRIAFPIYCFLLCEGMRHTRSPKKYILRLGIGILLAELPFDLLFWGGITWEYQSVMVTLTLGAVMLLCMGKTEKKWLRFLLVIPFAILAKVFHCDYDGWGIVSIAVFALIPSLPAQTLCLGLVCWLMGSPAIPMFGVRIPIELFAVLAMVPIALYSGRKLTASPALQWGFYLFYPVHLLVLWMISLL